MQNRSVPQPPKGLALRPPKGFRDFLPLEVAKRSYALKKLRSVFESFGYDALETPALEYASVLEGKYGDEERLIFKFEDRGGRQLALRFDQTVPLARVVAQYRDKLPLPLKRYQIQDAWRAEKPQAGRFRELTQCDIDIVGAASPLADAEIIAVVNAGLESLGFKDFLIHINDRRVLMKMLQESGVRKELIPPSVRILDKLEKIGEEEVIRELEKLEIPTKKIEILMEFLGRRPVLPKKAVKELPLEPIEEITKALKYFDIPQKRVIYTPTLARGLDYYTGMIIEATVEGYETGSVGGGGRYDNLMGSFGRALPAVGFAFGLDRLIEAMQVHQLLPREQSVSKVLVTIFNPDLIEASAAIARNLRKGGINCELYLDPAEKLQKQLKYADKKGIPFVIIVGPDEVTSSSATVKRLATGTQETLPLTELPKMLTS